MTIEEIKISTKAVLTAADIAPVLKCNPHAIRVQAHVDPGKLGFSVVCHGSRVLIPRVPFLDFLGERSGT